MSRTKKSRKPGTGSIGILKDDKKKLVEPKPRRAKKSNGNEAGNRQKEATPKINQNQNSAKNKDPRIGNKTPIDLGKPVNAPIKTKPAKKVQDNSPIAAIRVVETGESLADQLSRIEQDPRLLEILEKQDNEITLTSEEVNYFNTLMEQHEKISQELGLDDEDEVVEQTQKSDSEDDLWDKFNNSDLSKFE
ncbi:MULTISPECIES: Der GTPase-activating protein YihI [unclassified Colwellia]|jgi:ribosome assembly protein YihI (activator of Der GTPase)|uniref:Der GTPase-activating protein YihI n=1 Tax=unclassified Colwellia TaxID=196834 RepID=UPI000D3AAE51|nr:MULTISPECIES: Der GTPase-activating protein YihI [unclassified Colwellia]AWB59162.1 GTPase-activating protein [Colwellia sp. Arc7-D]MBA6414490.1 GTPase-activating protein [Colwellia sp. 6M3]|tara:strand:+ start:1511 stop:2083 length:573 start_codon:yes stop_codon:yes gene_type:complete